jgi:hypothetical protein
MPENTICFFAGFSSAGVMVGLISVMEFPPILECAGKEKICPCKNCKDRYKICGTTLIDARSVHLNACNGGKPSTDTEGKSPFPVALQGPFAAAPLSNSQQSPTLCEPALRFDLPVERFDL